MVQVVYYQKTRENDGITDMQRTNTGPASKFAMGGRYTKKPENLNFFALFNVSHHPPLDPTGRQKHVR